MKFNPKSKKELDEEKLLQPGVYPFEISQGLDKISRNGNEMIELLVRVFKPDGKFELVTDYLLESMAYKLRHAAEACGLLSSYEDGKLTGADFVGKSGTLKLKIQEAKGDWPAKNVVADYVVAKTDDPQAPLEKAAVKPPSSFVDDEIPF